MKKVLAAAVLAFVFGSTSAWACMCAYVQAPVEVLVMGQLETSSAVFSGKVVGYEFRKGLVTDFDGPPLTVEEASEREVKLVRFKVDRWWKMALPAEVLLTTEDWRRPAKEGEIPISLWSGCQLPLIEGESYLVYASGTADTLRYRACSRTASLAKAAEDLKVLGKGKRPLK